MNKLVLFIGGDLDGSFLGIDHHDLDHRSTYQHRVPEEFKVGEALLAYYTPKVEIYKREELQGQTERFVFFRLESLTVDEAFAKVFVHYN